MGRWFSEKSGFELKFECFNVILTAGNDVVNKIFQKIIVRWVSAKVVSALVWKSKMTARFWTSDLGIAFFKSSQFQSHSFNTLKLIAITSPLHQYCRKSRYFLLTCVIPPANSKNQSQEKNTSTTNAHTHALTTQDAWSHTACISCFASVGSKSGRTERGQRPDKCRSQNKQDPTAQTHDAISEAKRYMNASRRAKTYVVALRTRRVLQQTSTQTTRRNTKKQRTWTATPSRDKFA